MQSKSDRAKQKFIADRCQALIEVLLKNEDNKYCADCDAKGPRWASWNLGIFLCIRCAGIHRNLGVHISRVKSVNLDAWTPEHVAYVQRMGNGRARAIYEANLPADFRRPQTDAALETFIRAKYEHKRYIATDYVDPGPPTPVTIEKMEKKKSKASTGRGIEIAPPTTTVDSKSSSALIFDAAPPPTTAAAPAPVDTKHSSGLLLDLDLGTGVDQALGFSQMEAPMAQPTAAKISLESSSALASELSLNLTADKSNTATKDYILSLYNKR